MESAHHFSSKPDCTSTAEVPSLILRTALRWLMFSAPVRFLQGALVILVLLHASQLRSLEMSKDIVLPRHHFLQDVPNLTHENCLRVCTLMLTLLRPLEFLWSPPTILADRATGFPVLDRCPCYHLLMFRNFGTGLPVLDCVYFDVVRSLELEEPVDNPGTTIGTSISVFALHFPAVVNKVWFLTTCPLIGTSVIFTECSKRQHRGRILEGLYCHE